MTKVNYEFRNGWHTFSNDKISYSYCGDYKKAVEQLKRNYNLDDVQIIREYKNAMVYSDVVEMIKSGEVKIPKAKRYTVKHLQQLINQGFDIKAARFILIGMDIYSSEQAGESIYEHQRVPDWLIKSNYVNSYKERIVKVN